MDILGRPYVLFDPEQTAYIKKQEKERELQNRILTALNQTLEAIDEYVDEYTSTDDLRETIKDAIDKINYTSGSGYYEELEEMYVRGDEIKIEWME